MFKIPYGEKEGRLVHISEVARGLKCYCKCPVCKSSLIARKGEIISHHFAHHPGSDCNLETVVHYLGKTLLYEKISSAIKEGRELPIEWNCSYCPDKHKGNLVKKACNVLLEKNIGSIRPDITLVDENSAPVAIIEIVVSHKPDENVIDFCNNNDLPIIEFHIRTSLDIELLAMENALFPTKINICLRPKCPECNRPLSRKMLCVVDGKCWKCKTPMKIAFLSTEHGNYSPESFTEEEQAAARKQGALLELKYSATAERVYLANTCPNCHRFYGNFFMYEYSHLKSDTNCRQTGWACSHCKGS